MQKVIFVIIIFSIVFSKALFTIYGQDDNAPESGLVKGSINESVPGKYNIDSTLHESEKLNGFTYGFKAGIGLWRMMQLEGTANAGHVEVYSYPVSFSAGIFMENKLTEHFLIVNELFFHNSSTMVTIYPGYQGILEQEVTIQSLTAPILLKYKATWLWDTYFLFGPTFGYLINAKYKSYDKIYLDETEADIKDFASFNTAIEFGLGNKYQILSLTFLVEVRAQAGLTKYEHKEINGNNSGENIGEWKNYGLILLMGFQL